MDVDVIMRWPLVKILRYMKYFEKRMKVMQPVQGERPKAPDERHMFRFR